MSNSGAFDDFAAICEKARAQGAWIHVDGAFGLWAGATQRLKHLTSGYHYANSWAADAHKTLNAPYDSGILLCVDEEALYCSPAHQCGLSPRMTINEMGCIIPPKCPGGAV